MAKHRWKCRVTWQRELDWKRSGWVPLVCLREHGIGPYDPVKVDISASRVNEGRITVKSVTQSLVFTFVDA